MTKTERAPLKPGTVIDYCGERAEVVSDDGSHKLTVNCCGDVMDWYWNYDGCECVVVSEASPCVTSPV